MTKIGHIIELRDGSCHLVTGITEYGKEPKRITVSNSDGNFLVSESTVYSTVPADEKSADACCGDMGEAGDYGEWDVVSSGAETDAEKLNRILAENKAKQARLRDEAQNLERIAKHNDTIPYYEKDSLTRQRAYCQMLGC